MLAIPALLGALILNSVFSASAAFSAKDLQYGPEDGVEHAHPKPKNFDDTSLITVGLAPSMHQEMWKISCYMLGGTFIGLQSYYTVPKSNALNAHVYSAYRGWSPVLGFRAHHHDYALVNGESWDFITYRICGRKLTGIHFKGTKGGVSCGYYDYTAAAPGCHGNVLRPAAGRKIVGIYGDANGVWQTHAQGVRGIGLITLPTTD